MNDLLILINICSILTVIRLVYSLTVYYSAKADRITKMIVYHLNTFFAIKCLNINYPIRILWVMTLMMITILSIIIHILEVVANNDYKMLYNCIWNLFVTMFIVGYGNIYLSMSLGILIIVLCPFFGIIMISLITIS